MSNRARIRRRVGDGLYQVHWEQDDQEKLILQPLQQQQQHYQQYELPASQLSYQQVISPFSSSSVWGYTFFLGTCLATWFLYLLLPRGLRKQYFSAKRKRYVRSEDRSMPAGGYWLPVKRQQDMSTTSTNQARSPPPRSASPRRHHPRPSPPKAPSTPKRNPLPTKTPPSPEHPAIRKIPPNKIIAETMGRLQGKGIRMVAHGVHCNPKRVWITLDDDTNSVTWQTEFPRRVPDQSGQVSIVLMRGSLHRIALCNVLYIDVGKKTNALAQLPEKISDQSCFSLLTQNGSLDLQASSKLERDALVSCFSMILDDVHTEDWRAIYEATPEPSMANSSIANGNGGGSRVGKGTMLMNLRQ